ncbi:MAG: hypothetical protein ACUVX1_02120 [Chloroflexota bacterium]
MSFRAGDRKIIIGALIVGAAVVSFPFHREIFLLLAASGVNLLLFGGLALASKDMKDAARTALIFGISAALVYPWAEQMLFSQVDVAKYLVGSQYVLDTPIYVVSSWAYAMTLCAFIYLRVIRPMLSASGCSLAMAILATIVGVGVETVGNIVGLWASSPHPPTLGYVSLYVVLGYVTVFAFLPGLMRWPMVGGALCSAGVFSAWWVFNEAIGLLEGVL